MKYSINVINVLTAKTYKGIGRAWIVKNIKGNESIKSIIASLNRGAKENYQITVYDFEERSNAIKNRIEKMSEFMDGVVAIGDDMFPEYRGKVKNSEQPIVIFYKGALSLLKRSNKNIAVIGLLNPDRDIEIMEQEVVSRLVKNDVTIISGLALGCDSIAHRQALSSNGKTVAILPSPLDNVLPAKNRQLANEIVESNGLVITEYYEDCNSRMELGGRYQERDRLQALFSDAIILSASYAKNDKGHDSGSRLAMGYALSYSIPRGVIYNPVINKDNPQYDLSRQVISESDDTTIINQNNLEQSIHKIMSKEPFIEKKLPIQGSLFEF